jgi:hypothetical protein
MRDVINLATYGYLGPQAVDPRAFKNAATRGDREQHWSGDAYRRGRGCCPGQAPVRHSSPSFETRHLRSFLDARRTTWSTYSSGYGYARPPSFPRLFRTGRSRRARPELRIVRFYDGAGCWSRRRPSSVLRAQRPRPPSSAYCERTSGIRDGRLVSPSDAVLTRLEGAPRARISRAVVAARCTGTALSTWRTRQHLQHRSRGAVPGQRIVCAEHFRTGTRDSSDNPHRTRVKPRRFPRLGRGVLTPTRVHAHSPARIHHATRRTRGYSLAAMTAARTPRPVRLRRSGDSLAREPEARGAAESKSCRSLPVAARGRTASDNVIGSVDQPTYTRSASPTV